MNVLIILTALYLLANMLMMIYTGYLVANETRNLYMLFPFLIIYENLRKTYTFVGSIIPTVICALFMVIHILFMICLGIFAFVLGFFEVLWKKLFINSIL